MDTLLLPFSPRYIILTICAVVTALLIGIGIFDHNPKVWEILLIPIVIFGALTFLGIRDLTAEEPRGFAQLSDLGAYSFPARGNSPGDAAILLREREGRHAVLPRHPRPGLSARQDGARQAAVRHPGRRLSRRLRMDAPFDVAEGPRAGEQFRVTIGGPDCTKPYSASVFNISAMSFGALSPNAVRALNTGAKKGGFAHDTGEGGVSPYHRENGGDIIWEIGSGYFGCRNRDGSFNPEEFARVASRRPDQDGRTQDQPGRQARTWRRAAGGQGLGGDLQDPGRRRWARIAFRRPPTARFRRRWR